MDLLSPRTGDRPEHPGRPKLAMMGHDRSIHRFAGLLSTTHRCVDPHAHMPKDRSVAAGRCCSRATATEMRFIPACFERMINPR